MAPKLNDLVDDRYNRIRFVKHHDSSRENVLSRPLDSAFGTIVSLHGRDSETTVRPQNPLSAIELDE